EFLKRCSDSRELLDAKHQNIVHVEAASGRAKMVSPMLKQQELGALINESNGSRNTPSHLAAINWHPEIVSILTWDKRVNIKLAKNSGLTAADAAEKNMGSFTTFQMRLTWTVLKSAGVPRAPNSSNIRRISHTSISQEPPNGEKYKDRVNTLLLVATLVASVTFAADFTTPGGYNNSDLNQGMATLFTWHMFHLFLICDTIAVHISIIVVVTLIWAQLGDLGRVLAALKLAVSLLGLGLSMMSLAFTTLWWSTLVGLHMPFWSWAQSSWIQELVLMMNLKNDNKSAAG
ncbi:PGG domain, partial [Dillenia turbinata]